MTLFLQEAAFPTLSVIVIIHSSLLLVSSQLAGFFETEAIQLFASLRPARVTMTFVLVRTVLSWVRVQQEGGVLSRYDGEELLQERDQHV